MKQRRQEILNTLIVVLQDLQQTIVDEPEPINEETVPIGGLRDFDSLASVEATVSVLDTIGFRPEEFPSCPSIFISKNTEALTLGQVADRILKLESKRK